ncbi:hypothetical protein HYW54_04380 [Candidatus Gottesmanbacteria bacterium]|nr:hypothetical protein [Candidatus Gottesmanbacteria bacterium]
MNSLDAPQYALTQALVEKKTIKINNYTQWIYPDFAQYKNNIYSLRTPGESIVAIPFYLFAKTLQPVANFPYKDPTYTGITKESNREALSILYNATFGAAAAVLLFFLSWELTASLTVSIITSLSFGLGTLIWRYSSSFQRFSVVSFFLLAAFFIYIKYFLKKKFTPFAILIFGFSIGITFLIDHSVIFLLLLLSIAAFIETLQTPKALIKMRYFLYTALIPIFIFLLYNFIAFDNPFTSGYMYMETRPYFKNPVFIYSLPVFPGIITNLFSNGPIPRNVFPDKLWNDPLYLQSNTNMEWAIRNHYKGLFTQSPFLYLAIAGLLIALRKRKKIIVLSLLLSSLTIIQTSKLVYFYGPTAYDSHYFLPAVTFLIIGLAFWWKKILDIKNQLIKLPFILLSVFATLFAIYNGWYSALTNFAPHVTGEHRFYFEQLKQPFLHYTNENLSMLFINTFPNIYNIHLLFLFYFPLFFIIYLLLFQRKLTKRIISKLIHR